MYRRVEDFTGDFRHQAGKTLKLLRAIPEDAATRDLSPVRSIGRLAWHLTCAIGEIARNAGIGTIAPHDDQGDVPPMADIAVAYERAAAELGALIAREWSDEMLVEEIQVYGRGWRRGDLLSMLLIHEAHHRGQLSILMRQAGVTVPGVVGPSREEWATYRMEPQR